MKETKLNPTKLMKEFNKNDTVTIFPLCKNCLHEVIGFFEELAPYADITVHGICGQYHVTITNNAKNIADAE